MDDPFLLPPPLWSKTILSRFLILEPFPKSQVSEAKSQESEAESQESEAKSQESEAKNQELEAKSQE